MDVKNTHSVTKTEISVFGRQALDAERRRSPSLADKVLRQPSSLCRVSTYRLGTNKMAQEQNMEAMRVRTGAVGYARLSIL